MGGYVSWKPAVFAEKLSNEKNKSYQAPVDECATGDDTLSIGSVRDVGGIEHKVENDMIARLGGLGRGIYCGFKKWSMEFKQQASYKIQEVLPSPHSELVMGMVLGEDQFKLVPTYNDILKKVGLVHVVVVSGYNISLVFTLLMRILGSQYKVKNLVIGLFITLVYAGISGFGIPAVRAWIMGSIAVIFKFYGRPAEGIEVLIFSAIVILILAPSQLFSVSFMLSFLATLGVMVVPEALKGFVGKLGVKTVPTYLEDFNTSLSAQLMVNPVLSYYFGTISLVSLIANPLVLWVVPICTVLGGLLVAVAFISPLLSQILAFMMFPFLDFFVSFSEFFAKFATASVSLRFSVYAVFVYYLGLFIAIRHFTVKNARTVKPILPTTRVISKGSRA